MEKIKKQSKMYRDHNGNEIPSSYISKTDKAKDAAASKLAKKAADLNKKIAAFKAELFEECDKLYKQTIADAKVTLRENSRGGYSITTIDKSIKVQVTIAETIYFNEKIDLAKIKVNEYIDDLTQDSNPELKLLINEAFTTRRGGLDTKRVMGLFKLAITHPAWLEAMELIKQSIETNTSKRYATVWLRRPDGEYDAVKLDFSSI